MEQVLVTGAANGIGKAIATYWSEKGARVYVTDVDRDGAKKVANELDNATAYSLDVGNPEEIEAFFQSVEEPFDIVINNAGLSTFTPLQELTVADWDNVLNVNLRGVFLVSKHASKTMKDGSSIINIASTRASMSEPDSEAYAASKGGIVALTHALAASLSEKHIRVNAISPGWIHTGDYGELEQSHHDMHWSGRVGKPSDVAELSYYLAKSVFINGEEIKIDGGMTKKMIY
ncbi:SDR family oxidoreductase [Paenalkalicoccus suaedae]|uniref:SDR family oxidoreductase n=1 Tax=Paenalkalicoccus suaedae TaxID=2592382 RepID=A0A859FCE0_9BACI|nr:SDR family oxidoreductase [Paenalkalicoccus suaedae]QKS71013.1 SDR family oxidoreductase [Paenalkalicoccus suaedae]